MIMRELTAAVQRILATAPKEQIKEAQGWAADCMQYDAGEVPPVPYSVGYVVRRYPGGWDAFVSECCTPVQLDGYGSNYRPWERRPMATVTLDKI